PTGIGKTYIIKLIAKKLGVPFIKADATKFSETGYVGGDVEDLVRELVHEAEGDIARAEYGIIYLDEIDKIASGGNSNGPDVSRGGVQRNLLKLMEESEVDLKTPHDLASQVEAAMEAQRTGKVSRKKINTKNILFIVSGAFSNLDKIIKKRLDYKTIGFDGTENKKTDYSLTELFKTVTTQDLVDFGFESEFVGRLPVIVTLNEVDEDKLYKILQNPYSAVINSKKLDFKSYGIDVEFKDEALKFFAKEAAKQKTGARALMTVVERLLINYEKVLPSLEIKQLTVDDKLINDPEGILSEIMRTDSIRGYQRDFLASHGIHLSFDDEAITVIEKKAKDSKKSMKRICEDLFHDFPYAIKLMKLEEFRIT
ncbi:MAG TPA: AAA family ATPase, partial [Spirochaetota bacterium]|nr:AAA family ATPase [Spirochaetota bacterium]